MSLMMMKTNPITPPPGLVQQWAAEARLETLATQHICNQAARWGADQELEACCQWLDTGLMTPYAVIRLRSDRRPKPPTMKEQALAVLMALEIDEPGYEGTYNTIRRALEALDD
jgi:hypothetical protein